MNDDLKAELRGRKVSEVFKEFIEPYLAVCSDSAEPLSIQEIEEGLKLPWLIWNGCVSEKIGHNKLDYLASIKLILNNQPAQGKAFIESLIQRKKTLFSEYNYFLGDYSLYLDEHTKEARLSVEALKSSVISK